MSHVATIEIVVKDLDALRAAAKRCGLEFREGQKTYKWFGQHVGDYKMPAGFTAADLGKCDHAIAVPGNDRAYEIGVVFRNDRYVLLWDFWAGGHGLEAKVGKNAGVLQQAYAVEQARRAAKRQGFRVVQEQRIPGPGNKIKLVVAR